MYYILKICPYFLLWVFNWDVLYSKNKIRKTQNEHLITVCQNLIVFTGEFKVNFFCFFVCLYLLIFCLETTTVVS